MKSLRITWKSIGISVAILAVGFVAGFLVSTKFCKMANDLPQYSPDESAKIILRKGNIVGSNWRALRLPKEKVYTVAEGGGKRFFRLYSQSPRYAMLLTAEEDRVIEVEIWNRIQNGSVFYEIDPDAMARYARYHPANSRGQETSAP